MKKIIFPFFVIILTSLTVMAQNVKVPVYYETDYTLTRELTEIVEDLGLDATFDVGEDGTEKLSFAVIDLSSGEPKLGGYNYSNFIYPASVYKMYVAAEVLDQVSDGDYDLDRQYVAEGPNVVDTRKEIETDPRPLLKDGDTVTVNYLLDLMITRSDNSASNCMIDIADRKNINEMIKKYGWEGSEVTRKFLSRKYEDPGYEDIRGTETCAMHAADFMYRIYTGRLGNHWVSAQLKTFLGRQLDKSKLAQGLPRRAMFYHKTGWWSYWTNDVGIVEDGRVKYIIACFMPLTEEEALPKFKELSERVYEVMRQRSL